MLVKVEVASLYSGLLACGENRRGSYSESSIPPCPPGLLSSEKFAQDTLLWDTPSVNSLMLIVPHIHSEDGNG